MKHRVYYGPSTGEILYTLSAKENAEFPESEIPFLEVPSISGNLRDDFIVQGESLQPRNDVERLSFLIPGAVKTINTRCGELRSHFVTPLPGQEMLYLKKEQEALDYQNNPSGSHPLLEAEVNITGANKGAVATTYLTQAALWKTVAASIEAIRLGYVNAVENVTTVGEFQVTMAGFEADYQTLKTELGL